MTSSDQPKRSRNAAATRAAILHSARMAFSRAGYDGVGLREIAQEAGVTAILVNRYFGSKEDLFREVVEAMFADGSLFAGSLETLSARIARLIVTKTREGEVEADPLLLMLRSAPNARASEILRESIKRHFEDPLAGRLAGEDAALRVGLILALIAGFQLMHRMIGSAALVGSAEPALSGQLQSLLQMLIGEGGQDRI
jgi:AcrR family transcriptional regulator